MQKLIEFYEMASLNDASLRPSERVAIRRARRALRNFHRAMEILKACSATDRAPEASFRIAA